MIQYTPKLYGLVSAGSTLVVLFSIAVLTVTPVTFALFVGVLLFTLVEAVIPVKELFIFDRVVVTPLSIVNAGGTPELLLKSSFIVVWVCVCVQGH